jgi:hypothetical protein
MDAKRRRKPFDAATKAAIKHEYEESNLTLEAIGEKHGRSGAWVCKLAKLRGWKRRRPPDEAVPPRRRTRRNPRTVMRRRMCKVINGKLKEMEQGMKTGDMSAADVERNTKVVTSMLGGLYKLGAPEEDKVGDAQSTNAGAKDDVERLQREIIERFERIQRRRQAERGSA